LLLRPKSESDSHGDFVQANVLDGGPNNGQATVLGGEDVNLIGALPDIAKETLDGIGALNMPMHGHRNGKADVN